MDIIGDFIDCKPLYGRHLKNSCDGKCQELIKQENAMAENGTNNGNQERNEKGQFAKGNRGGPGRSNTTKKILDDIENVLKKDLRSSDPKVRHPAARLLINLKKLQGDSEEKRKGILSPAIKLLLQHVTDQQDEEDDCFSLVDDDL